jgi:hypothetical protein
MLASVSKCYYRYCYYKQYLFFYRP